MKKRSILRYRIESLLPYSIRRFVKKIFAWNKKRKANSTNAKLENLRNILIYNNPVTEVPPATGKLRLLQQGNAVFLAYFAKKCDEYGLRYWLDSGSLLGSIRHKGFIPWDDDLDVCMMEPDFEKLLSLMDKIFPKSEGFTYHDNAFLQIGFEGTPLNIDVIPYKFYCAPLDENNRIELSTELATIKRSMVGSNSWTNKTRAEVNRIIEKDIFKGLAPAPEDQHPAIFRSPHIPFDLMPIFSYDVIFPRKKAIFEGMEFWIPNKARFYLRYFYGDYMTYPPKLGVPHTSVENMLKHVNFEVALEQFIDTYGN